MTSICKLLVFLKIKTPQTNLRLIADEKSHNLLFRKKKNDALNILILKKKNLKNRLFCAAARVSACAFILENKCSRIPWWEGWHQGLGITENGLRAVAIITQ